LEKYLLEGTNGQDPFALGGINHGHILGLLDHVVIDANGLID
jgi:hypothetical protein